MRITFDIDGKPSAYVSLYPYSARVDRPPQAWNGARCELLIVDLIDWEKDSRKEGDAVYIEGSADVIRAMLNDALRMLDANEKLCREQQTKIFLRTVECPQCRAYADPVNEWHGDGKGSACYGLVGIRAKMAQEHAEKHSA